MQVAVVENVWVLAALREVSVAEVAEQLEVVGLDGVRGWWSLWAQNLSHWEVALLDHMGWKSDDNGHFVENAGTENLRWCPPPR